MTLRTIESQFSETLLKQESEAFPVNLTMDGPISHLIHPKVLWATLQFQNNPQQETPSLSITGWYYDCFKNSSAAREKYPHIALQFTGRPWNIYQFQVEGHSEAIIDFQDLGAVVISRESLNSENKNELFAHVLPHWLNYALSPELWDINGKWPRFHERILKLLKTKDLIEEHEYPGYYPLKASAKKLESFGFIGSQLDKTYVLVLPWSFSLTTLKKLEEVLDREF
jgi:hypothetical protein